ncbi:unnamed protein product, partial [Rotaria socialis]
ASIEQNYSVSDQTPPNQAENEQQEHTELKYMLSQSVEDNNLSQLRNSKRPRIDDNRFDTVVVSPSRACELQTRTGPPARCNEFMWKHLCADNKNCSFIRLNQQRHSIPIKETYQNKSTQMASLLTDSTDSIENSKKRKTIDDTNSKSHIVSKRNSTRRQQTDSSKSITSNLAIKSSASDIRAKENIIEEPILNEFNIVLSSKSYRLDVYCPSMEIPIQPPSPTDYDSSTSAIIEQFGTIIKKETIEFVMSTNRDEVNDKDLLIPYIKCEDNTNDDFVYDQSAEFNDKKDRWSNALSTSARVAASLSSAQKGKIEVTSKGRRKIFDGVRWQILCKRPECRKQTNKKSLCITHYKEEYEVDKQSSWSSSISSFQVPSYQQQRHSFENTHTENEDQNNTITTTNITDNDEHALLNSNKKQVIREGQIQYRPDGRRFVFKNSKWLPLCKYDSLCRNTAKYDLLCIKHLQLTQQKRQEALKFHSNDHRGLRSSIFSNDTAKRLKTNSEFQISSSSITEQFNINGRENHNTATKQVNGDFSSVTSKPTGHEIEISTRKNFNILSSDKSLFDKQKSTLTTDQSVQTDLAIPLCCIIHQEDHSFYSSCQNNKSTSSSLSYDTKFEPQCFNRNFST